MSETLPPPVWVHTIEQLRKMVEDLAAQPRVAVDTESNSLHAFREQVCLVQFSSPKADYLVDPLAVHDLSLLAPIFSNPIHPVNRMGSVLSAWETRTRLLPRYWLTDRTGDRPIPRDGP